MLRIGWINYIDNNDVLRERVTYKNTEAIALVLVMKVVFISAVMHSGWIALTDHAWPFGLRSTLSRKRCFWPTAWTLCLQSSHISEVRDKQPVEVWMLDLCQDYADLHAQVAQFKHMKVFEPHLPHRELGRPLSLACARELLRSYTAQRQ